MSYLFEGLDDSRLDDFMSRLEQFRDAFATEPGFARFVEQVGRDPRLSVAEIDELAEAVCGADIREIRAQVVAVSQDHTLGGDACAEVGEILGRVVQSVVLERWLFEQGISAPAFKGALQSLLDPTADVGEVLFWLTTGGLLEEPALSRWAMWATWSAVGGSPFGSSGGSDDWRQLVAELGLHPEPAVGEEWIFLEYLLPEPAVARFPRIFDMCAEDRPWNPYFLPAAEEDGHGWTENVLSRERGRPECVHEPVGVANLTGAALLWFAD